ncbi:chemotaxis protein CheW [Bacillus sp. X1(2014)]|nr:chemotaxis protein CheW [Bacillus sp. X1(2014)]
MEMVKIIVFKLGEEEYALDIEFVQSIERIQPITRVPNAPSYVKGLMNLRGNVIPIIDLRKKLNIGEANFTDHTRIIISKYEDIELGFIVDQTSDVIDVSRDELEMELSGRMEFDAFGGIVNFSGRLIILLKMEELVKTEVK